MEKRFLPILTALISLLPSESAFRPSAQQAWRLLWIKPTRHRKQFKLIMDVPAKAITGNDNKEEGTRRSV